MSSISYAQASTIPFAILSEFPHQFAYEKCNESPFDALHYLWLTPVNIVTNLAAMVLMPVVSVVNLVVAAIFALIGSCCSDPDDQEEWYESAKENGLVALIFSTLGEAVLLSRVFNVNASHGFGGFIESIFS